ncbi:hypothetical protein MPSEU_001003500 [Mayamaea pseudoterrestris]|nr:hypothetical protein MPSEU_001003500 [Mayamaea pseudoterrestris]
MTTNDIEEPDLIKLIKAPKPSWSLILKRVREHPSEARYIDPVTGQTVLHWAIERRSTSQSRLQVIMSMLAWYPGATMVRCKLKGYTPLDKVCVSRTENEFILESDAKVAELLIKSSTVKELLVNSRNNLERLSPLSLHVKAMSLLQARIKHQVPSNAEHGEKKQHLHRASKVVLGAIAPHCSLETLSEALETLYLCNSLVIMDMISQEESRSRRSSNNGGFDFGKQSRKRSAKGHWIWEWLLDMLAVLHTRSAPHRQAPFHALHLLSKIPNCPPPFLQLAMRAYPYDVKTPDPTSGNLPLHNVAEWTSQHGADSNVRKYMCIESLSAAHETGLAEPNVAGKTPVQLDNEAGTNLLDMGVSGHDQSSGSRDDDGGDEVDDEFDDDEEGESLVNADDESYDEDGSR